MEKYFLGGRVNENGIIWLRKNGVKFGEKPT